MFQELLKDEIQTFSNENKRLQYKLHQIEAYSSHSAAGGGVSFGQLQSNILMYMFIDYVPGITERPDTNIL